MSRGTYVEIEIAATSAQLWPLITDLNMPAKFSGEFRGARWAEGIGWSWGRPTSVRPLLSGNPESQPPL